MMALIDHANQAYGVVYNDWTTNATTMANVTWQYAGPEMFTNLSKKVSHYVPAPPPAKIKQRDEGHEEFAWLDGRIAEICDYAFA
jgi:hypothetical protein